MEAQGSYHQVGRSQQCPSAGRVVSWSSIFFPDPISSGLKEWEKEEGTVGDTAAAHHLGASMWWSCLNLGKPESL